MRIASFDPLLRDRPKRLAEVDLAPGRVGQFASAHHRQKQQICGCPDGWRRADPLDVLVH